MNGKRVRLAVIGAGLIGARHAELAQDHPDCDLVAIVDPAPNTANLASRLGCAWHSELATIVDGSLDAAIVATPNALHLPVALACLERGLPCLVEKPVADTLDNAQTMVDAFEHAGLPLLVGHHRRYHPFVAATRDLLASGEIGSPVCASIIWAVRKPDSYFADGPWRLGADGGPLMLNLIHEIDLMRHVFGDIAEVTAMVSNHQRQSPVEDTAAVSFRFASGMLATAILSDAALTPWSFEGASGENPNIATTGIASWRVGCTRGAFDFPTMEVWRHAGEGAGDWSKPLQAARKAQQSVKPLHAQLTHFIRLVQGLDSEPLVSGREGLEALRAIRAIQHSAATGQTVKLAAFTGAA